MRTSPFQRPSRQEPSSLNATFSVKKHKREGDLTVGVELTRRWGPGPDDGDQAHRQRNSANAVVYGRPISDLTTSTLKALRLTDITVGRAHRRRRHTEDGLDGLAGPTQLGDDLLVRERCKRLRNTRPISWYIASMSGIRAYPVRPSVHANLMAGHVLFDQDRRTFDDTRTHDEERRVDSLFR